MATSITIESFDSILAAARQAQPALTAQFNLVELFRAFVQERIEGDQVALEVAREQAGDLFLACAVLQGDAAALALFEAGAIAPLDPALVGIVGASHVTEVKQRTRQQLLVAAPGATPRLAGYAGRGPLRAWVRAVAVRIALRMRREAGHEPLDFDLPIGDGDPALRLLRERHGDAFREAFEAALRGLPDDDQLLLRSQYIDGVGVEELAARLGVHRVTIFRRLGKVRLALLDATRRELATRLGIPRGELDSLMRAVKSGFQVTLERVLARDP